MLREREFSRLVGRLEAALGKRVRVLRDEAPPPSAIDSFQLDGRHRLSVAGGLTEQEKALICLFLGEWRQNRVQEPDSGEPLAILEKWLKLTEVRGGFPHPPPSVEELFRKERVPFLAVHPALSGKRMSGLKRVVSSYFEDQAWLVPLNRAESLLLLPLSFIYGEDTKDQKKGLEETAQGLVEVIITEAGEDVRVVVHPAVGEAHLLPRAIATLREVWRIGRTHRPADPVYTTWQFSLEKLLESVDEERVNQFLADVSSTPFWEDEELCQTLEAFLEQDLNVSETARRMFIHRNTLIYRLERLRQESGLDARRFEDAVRIRLALRLSRLFR